MTKRRKCKIQRADYCKSLNDKHIGPILQVQLQYYISQIYLKTIGSYGGLYVIMGTWKRTPSPESLSGDLNS